MGSLSSAPFLHHLQEAGEEEGSSATPVSCFLNYLCQAARDYKAEEDPVQHLVSHKQMVPLSFGGGNGVSAAVRNHFSHGDNLRLA